MLRVGFSTLASACDVSGTAPVAVDSLLRVRRALRRVGFAVSGAAAAVSTRTAAGSAETSAAVPCPAPAGVDSPRHQLSMELDQLDELDAAGTPFYVVCDVIGQPAHTLLDGL